MVRRETNERAVKRRCIIWIPDDRHGDKVDFPDLTAGGIEIDPSGAGQINLRPSMGRPTRRTACPFGLIVRDGKVPGRKSRGHAKRTRRFDHQHRKVAAATVAELERFQWLLDALSFPSPVAETLLDALREANEKIERVRRPAGERKFADPMPYCIARVGMMAFNIAREFGRLGRAVVERKGSCIDLNLNPGGACRRMVQAYCALE